MQLGAHSQLPLRPVGLAWLPRSARGARDAARSRGWSWTEAPAAGVWADAGLASFRDPAKRPSLSWAGEPTPQEPRLDRQSVRAPPTGSTRWRSDLLGSPLSRGHGLPRPRPTSGARVEPGPVDRKRKPNPPQPRSPRPRLQGKCQSSLPLAPL